MDSIGVEPGELTFKKVHTNYLKAKRSSSKRWLLILLFSLFAIGCFTAWWFYNSNSQNEQLAVTDSKAKSEVGSASNSLTDNTIESAAKSSGENESNTTNSNRTNNSTQLQTETSPESAPSINEKEIKSINENNKTDNDVLKNNTVISSKESAKSENRSTSSSENRKHKKSASSKNSNVSASNNNSSKSNFDQTSQTKAGQTENNNSFNDPSKAVSKSTTEKQGTKTIPTPEKEEKQITDSKTIPDLNEKTDTANKKDSTLAISEPDNKTTTPEQKLEKTDTVGKDPAKKVNDPKTNDLLTSATTPSNISIDVKKHHFFYLSTELVYYNISYQAVPNGKVPSMYTQNNVNFPKLFSDGNPKGSSKIISGGLSLGYSFKNSIGANIGITYFSVENKINGKAFAQTKTQMVLDHYVYDSTMQVIDTIYKVGSTRKINVVNGDTVEAQDYLNNIKYISIPINLSYKLKFNSKFGIEPSVGMQYAIPLTSYQLIALKDNTFTYSKTKNFMNARSIFFDVAMKFNYNLNPNAALYLKPGYYFNNRSVYNVDYALDYRLKNLYVAFGLTLKLK